ncbi:stress responsive A/B barrel domain-containing protein [Mollisia scopiformis]|uniref:Stress responsive A/B barrel domain-containing protein n=1 Tax=Mollisia scopiformis TaxID=149040 RepID=A0A194X534_MOLSC|nr:stress responsive A/B barrel domain-containing protein [Mollisia scopiformis]KUJ15288.1 stress responsive A/B barrel domain-containing protein [Mollisia scopiformis]
MTVIHVVLFKFLPTTSPQQKSTFLREVKSLATLPCVEDQRLIVGGPSISEPKEVSQGFEFGLVSFHPDRKALEEYQASAEHGRVADNYIKPFKENVIRFDFEVPEGDEHLVGVLPMLGNGKK